MTSSSSISSSSSSSSLIRFTNYPTFPTSPFSSRDATELALQYKNVWLPFCELVTKTQLRSSTFLPNAASAWKQFYDDFTKYPGPLHEFYYNEVPIMLYRTASSGLWIGITSSGEKQIKWKVKSFSMLAKPCFEPMDIIQQNIGQDVDLPDNQIYYTFEQAKQTMIKEIQN